MAERGAGSRIGASMGTAAGVADVAPPGPIDPKVDAMRAIQLVAPLGRFIPEVEEPSGGKRVQFK